MNKGKREPVSLDVNDLVKLNSQAHEYERCLLGSWILENDSVAESPVEPKDFDDPRHEIICKKILELRSNGFPVDLVLLKSELQREAIEIEYIASLIDVVPTARNAAEYARRVRDCSIKRELYKQCFQIMQAATNGEQASELLERAHTIISKLKTKTIQQDSLTSSWHDLGNLISPISWSWDRWLANGFSHLLVAQSGLGKSALVLDLTSRFTTGNSWPDGSPFNGNTGKVLWCETEAGHALNLHRAQQWKIDIQHILNPFDDPTVDIQLNVPEHRNRILSIMQRPDVRVLVVDSLRGAHSQKEDKSEMFSIMKFIAEISQQTGKESIVVHHLNKPNEQERSPATEITLDRIRGSSAIVQLARVIWAIDKPDPQNEKFRLSVIKSNLGLFPDPIGFQVTDSGVLFGSTPQIHKNQSTTDKAHDLLSALLRSGPVRSVDLQEEMEQAGLSWDSAKRAKDKMNVVVFRKNHAWYWSLPAHEEYLK